jgi:DNA-binding NarL/FixJ family response regulator
MAFKKGRRVSFEFPVIKARRVRVEQFLMEGMLTERQIARRVGASLRTVAADVAAIYYSWLVDSNSYWP